MISYSDKKYKQTKLIMLGKKTMNEDFKPLADFIHSKFGVQPINIVYDLTEKGTSPRLGIYFEYSHELLNFYVNNKIGYLNTYKQNLISRQFQYLTTLKENNANSLLYYLKKIRRNKYLTNNIFVYYSAFEPIAKVEANERVPLKKIKKLKSDLNCKDIWDISTNFSRTTFFLYTEDQVKYYENSETKKIWADKYFNILEPYNEFGYFKRDNFNIYLDSKENFDNNYSSNWYYYYK